jgi:hypothetical protein
MHNYFKKHNIKTYKVLLIGVIIVCCSIIISLSTMVYLISERIYRQSVNESLADPLLNLQSQERDYKQKIKDIFAANNVNQDYATLRDKIIEVNVPSSLRDEHFRLVVALEEMAKGDKKNQVVVDKQLNLLKKQAGWLAELLTNFVFHNL